MSAMLTYFSGAGNVFIVRVTRLQGASTSLEIVEALRTDVRSPVDGRRLVLQAKSFHLGDNPFDCRYATPFGTKRSTFDIRLWGRRVLAFIELNATPTPLVWFSVISRKDNFRHSYLPSLHP